MGILQSLRHRADERGVEVLELPLPTGTPGACSEPSVDSEEDKHD